MVILFKYQSRDGDDTNDHPHDVSGDRRIGFARESEHQQPATTNNVHNLIRVRLGGNNTRTNQHIRTNQRYCTDPTYNITSQQLAIASRSLMMMQWMITHMLNILSHFHLCDIIVVIVPKEE